MAYKFQVGAARLSGSTVFEQSLSTLQSFGAKTLSSSAGLQVGGTVELDGVDDASVAVGADKFYIRDATDGLMKTEAVGDLMSAVAGAGLIESSDQLAVQVDDSTIEINSDSLRVKDAGVTGAKLNTDVISAQTELASDGLAAADEMMISDGGVLKKIGVDNLFKDGPGLLGAAAIDVSADHFMFLDGGATGDAKTESISDLAVAMAGAGIGPNNGTFILDLNELGAAAVNVAADSIAIIDADDSNGSKKESISDLMTAVAGDGLAASSGVLAVGVDDSSIEINSDSLRIKAGGVTDAMLDDGVATGLAGVGLAASSGVMALDLNELSAANIASGDFLTFVDSDDSNKTRKESIDDIATLFAGAGLAASSAVLSVQVSGALKVESDKVGISGSFAGDGIKFLGGADSISSIELDVNELPAGTVANGDFFAFVDAR